MSSGRSRQTLSITMLVAAVLFGLVLAGGLDLTPSSAAAPPPPAPAAPETPAGRPAGTYLPSFADLAESALPAVVSIEAQTIGSGQPRRNQRGAPADPFHFFFGPPREEGREEPREYRSDAGGSGFVISADGEIVTNNHVIDGATKIRVRLDGRYYVAELKGTDPATDLALLKIDAGAKLAHLPLGDSDQLRVGDYVMAIGNPLLLDHTVTVGVVSAKGRAIGLTQDSSFENFIQTDAAINRGNSGGPLVNLNGEVVGIATAMNWGAENIGFAVPVKTLQAILPQLREKGHVSRGYLGVNIENLEWETAQAFGLKDNVGALVDGVTAGSPAEKAGLRHGDIIVAVDGRAVENTRDLIDYVSSRAPGKKVSLELLRDGEKVTREVELGERQAIGQEVAEREESGDRGLDWLGLDYQTLTPGLRQNFGLPGEARGVVVTDLAASSPLYDEGLAPGDVITEVNGRPIDDADSFESTVAGAPSGTFLRLYVQRFRRGGSGDGAGFFAIVRVP